ncbi:ATP-dependent helicase HrpB [Synechococcus sp. RSCCF101]|uniref:ATP-dependent helicase HrpB n=1 Tax=Synechococcus sp. RSCCF101 TaxID=2511069 RepID=UPI002105E7FA|nr:ATP-dependent helicase HrpB [Synechococcus sp. RSCCF101]
MNNLGPGAVMLLEAPPGAGKTTRVPPALLESMGRRDGSVLMIEPRRIAARSAAARMAGERQESVGGTIGYSIRHERRISSDTRIEVVTDGVFLRRLQNDPALEGVGCVIVDEVHERRRDSDLALALLQEARRELRPDLRLMLMSATLDQESLSEVLPEATVLRSPGRCHPVETIHQPPRRDESIERQVLRALDSERDTMGAGGTALVFLPGLGEIRRVQRWLESSAGMEGWEVVPLHGQLSLEAQRRALAPAKRDCEGKVVLASAIAESSLTIENVRLVIDSGLARRQRHDRATGMDGLFTEPCSLASADQRRGRAGRQGPGRCVRLWSAADHGRRQAHAPPELLEADPLPLALNLAEWGAGLGETLRWLTPPPRQALEEASRLLEALDALDGEGRITAHGRSMARLGLHPRLAHMLLSVRRPEDTPKACAIAALLSERDPLSHAEAGSDLDARLQWLAASARDLRAQSIRRLAGQLRRQLAVLSRGEHTSPGLGLPPDPATGELVALAYPERVALRREGHPPRFLMRQGRGARLTPQDPLASCEALAIAAADLGQAEARVLLAAPLSRRDLQAIGEREGQLEQTVHWDAALGRVRAEQQRHLGAIPLDSQPWPDPPAERVATALLEAIRASGMTLLPWDRSTRALQARLGFLHRRLGSPWPDRSDPALLADLELWLLPMLHGLRRPADLEAQMLREALWSGLPWSLREQLDQLAPARLRLPGGREHRLEYASGEPVLAVKLQDLFGWQDGPRVLGGRESVTLHLLSPAGRPLQITRDLRGFWLGSYRQVRQEMRGRYPRHQWPEHPLEAEAVSRTGGRTRNGAGPR